MQNPEPIIIYFFRANNTEKVECPACFQKLCMSKFQTVDYKAHLKIGATFEKKLTESMYMNEELAEQKEKVMEQLQEIEKHLEEAKLKLETYRCRW